MKNHRVMWEWNVKLWIPDDATPEQEEKALDEIAKVVDDWQVRDWIMNRVGPYGIKVEVTDV